MSEPRFTIPIRFDDVPAEGLHVERSADADVRSVLAALANVDAVLRLDATFDVVRRGRSALAVTGEVSATVRQTCVVTLDPVENEIREPVDVVFAPPRGQAAEPETEPETELVVAPEGEDPPEPLVDGIADLGRVATEFLLLAVDPYPRKAGVVFEPPAAADEGNKPFAALAALQKKHNPSS